MTGNIDKIIEAGVTLFIALVENLPKIIIELVKAVPKIIKALIDGFAEALPKMAEVGLDLIKGLWQGISDAGAWLWEKISGFFGGIVDGIKDFFGIKSPSKLFENEIGANLAEGIGVGFEKTMSKVTDDMKDAMPTPDLFALGEISLPKRNTISFLDTNKALNSSGSINQKNDFQFEKMVDITFTGNINNDTLPELKRWLSKEVPDLVYRDIVGRMSARGVKLNAIKGSF
jgi:phage-related protein